MTDRRLVGVLGFGAAVGGSMVAFACGSSNSGAPGVLGGTGGGDSGPVVDSTSIDSASGDTGVAHDSSAPDGSMCRDAGAGNTTECSGLCTNTQTDVGNCGHCGNSCSTMGASAECVGGACVCNADAGSSLCGSTCVDTLTDPNNCGACGHTCQVLGTNGGCTSGLCTPATVATGQGPIWGITVSATTIYFTGSSPGATNGQVLQTNFSAINQVSQVPGATNLADPRGITIDLGTSPNNIYWVDYGDTTVDEVKLLGSAPKIDWPAIGDAGFEPPTYAQPLGVTVDAQYIYWTANGAGAVLRMPIGNGGAHPPQVLSSGETQPVAIAVDATNVYWVDFGTPVIPGSVRQMPKDGSGSVTTLAANEPSPWGIAIDANNVYWTDQVNPGYVKQVPIGGGTIVTLASGEGAPYGIAVDPTSPQVFWTSADTGYVSSVPVGGGSTVRHAGHQSIPKAIAVDQENVYWVNSGTNSILAVTK